MQCSEEAAHIQSPISTSRTDDNASTATLHGSETTNVRWQFPTISNLRNGYANE